MRKITALLLVLIMCLTFAGCEAKAEKITKTPDGEVVPAETKVKKYEEMTLDEQFAYRYENPINESAEKTDNGLLAPARDSKTHLYGYINSKGEWVLNPSHAAACPFSGGFAAVLDDYSDYIIIREDGTKFVDLVNRNGIKGTTYLSEDFFCVSLDCGFEQSKLYLSFNGISMILANSLPKTKGLSYENSDMFAVATPFVDGHAVVMRRTNESVLDATGFNRANMQQKNYYQSPCVINAHAELTASLPAGFDITDDSLDENGLIIVQDMTNEDELFGLCDTEGNIVVECQYRRIEHCEGDYYLVCSNDGFWGYIYKTGKATTELKYEDALCYSENLAAVCEDGLWGVINAYGEYVIRPQYDEIAPLVIPRPGINTGEAAFAEGLAAARMGDYWALIDPDGNIKVSVKADGCPFLSVNGGMIAFRNEEGFWGLLDSECNVVFEPMFEDIGQFGR